MPGIPTALQGIIRHDKYPCHRVALGEVSRGTGCDGDCHEMELFGDDPVAQGNADWHTFIVRHSQGVDSSTWGNPREV